MKLSYNRYIKIKKTLEQNIPKSLIVMIYHTYKDSNNRAIEFDPYLELINQYCTDFELNNIKKSFKDLLDIDIDFESSNRLPLFKKHIKEVDSGNSKLDIANAKISITTNFSNGSEDESDQNIEKIDNKMIEKIINRDITIDISGLGNKSSNQPDIPESGRE